MADLPNLLPYFKTTDFSTPLEVGAELAEKRENARTQRMFAENTARRQAAQDLREERRYNQEMTDKQRELGIQQATAVGTIGTLSHTNPGAAMALAHAWGMNPILSAATPPSEPDVAGNTPTSIDTEQQALPSNSAEDVASAGSNELPAEGRGEPPADIMPANERAPFGLVNDEQKKNAPDAELETLMTQSIHPETLGAEYEAAKNAPLANTEHPSNPLLSAVEYGGQRYELPNTTGGTGLGKKYDDMLKSMIDAGDNPDLAKKYVEGRATEDSKSGNRKDVAEAEIADRFKNKQGEDSKYKLTTEQRLKLEKDKMINAQIVARIRAASQGAATPDERAALDTIARMKEEGASTAEIAAAAAPGGLLPKGINPKVWEPLAHSINQEENANTRTEERRAGLEATDAEGNKIGSGVYKNTNAASKGAESEPSFAQLDQRLKALIADIREHGNRTLSPNEIQKRNSLYNQYAAAARKYNNLAATTASQKLEEEIASARGTPGHGFLFGANPEVLEHLLEEARASHVERQRVYVRSSAKPLPGSVSRGGGTEASKGGKFDALEAQVDRLVGGK
jgi:hypothetical protein